jgi:phospholipid/cholesterol/gamma-HCH transport system substrate-binding protein
MAKEKLNNVRLGLFVTVASILLLAAVYLIGSNKAIFGSSTTVLTFLADAGGLQAGNNVRFAGINVGTVKKIEIIADTAVKVELRLMDKTKTFVRKNATTSVSIDGLVGSALINIRPGKGTAAPVGEGDTLASENMMGTSDLIANLGSTNDNLASFVQELLTISHKINNGPGLVPMLIQDSIMASNIQQMITNLNRTTYHTVKMVEKLSESIDEIKQGQGMINQLLYDTTIINNLKHLSASVDQGVSYKVDTIMQQLTETSHNLSRSTQDFHKILEGILQGEGAVSQLLYDPEIALSIQRTLDNIEKGTAKFDEDMEALKHNFLFRRYFRKQEKIKEKDAAN